jgi:hypothetical protein
MRMLAGCLIVTAGLAAAQTPQELRNRYGEPDVERFSVRPGIGLAVEYGSDHLACQMLIQPPQHLLNGQEEQTFMRSETVTEILEEVVPVAARGLEKYDFHMVSGCNNIDGTEYENMSITRSTNNCLPLKPEREVRAQVIFRRDVCRSQK